MPPFHPSRLLLLVERDPSGGLVVSSPHLPGWRAVARSGPLGIAQAVDRGWRENAVRAYANGRGQAYDLEHLADPEPEPEKPHRFAGWHELDDGRWQAPGGRRYRADAWIVQRVRDALADDGRAG